MTERKENIILDKSFAFAVRIIRLFKVLAAKHEYVMSKQLLRSGTSVGANIREAVNGESKADFIHKLSMSQKEMAETCYWLDLLYATEYLNESEYNSIKKDADDIMYILTRIIVSTKQNLNSKPNL
jgi:four helix bundle protein